MVLYDLWNDMKQDEIWKIRTTNPSVERSNRFGRANNNKDLQLITVSPFFVYGSFFASSLHRFWLTQKIINQKNMAMMHGPVKPLWVSLMFSVVLTIDASDLPASLTSRIWYVFRIPPGWVFEIPNRNPNYRKQLIIATVIQMQWSVLLTYIFMYVPSTYIFIWQTSTPRAAAIFSSVVFLSLALGRSIWE